MLNARENGSPLINREECAFIIIDAQEKLMPVISGKDDLLANCIRLARFCLITDIPIIITEQEKLGNTMPELADIVGGQRVFKKTEFNCFFNQDFAEYIRTLKRQNLIIAGVEAHICIAQTTLSGLENYAIHVVGDAVSSRAAYNKEIALNRVHNAGAVITSTEMFIYEVLQRAGTDEFKSVLPLVK